MKRLVIIFIIITATMVSYAQLCARPLAQKPPTKKENISDQENQTCIHRNKIAVLKRLKIFPFNRTTKVQLVSFVKPDSVKFNYRLPEKDGVVDYSKMNEVKTLDSLQINALTDILYNYGFRGVFHSFTRNNCFYNPRNAILFADNDQKVFAYIEICFECDDYRVSSKQISMGDMCFDKYALLRNFFLSNGIHYGINNE